MGLGPRGSSLLHKLGLRPAYELTEAELLNLVSTDRERRVVQRTLGRVMRQTGVKPKTGHKVKTKASAPTITLESLGLDPNIVAKLRAGGKSDMELILLLRKSGLIK